MPSLSFYIIFQYVKRIFIKRVYNNKSNVKIIRLQLKCTELLKCPIMLNYGNKKHFITLQIKWHSVVINKLVLLHIAGRVCAT